MRGLADLPLGEIARQLVLEMLPAIVLDPVIRPLFALLLGLVAFQYVRVGYMERTLYGSELTPTWQRMTTAIACGVVGGLFGGLVMVVLGVTLEPGDVRFLWPVALVLALIQPRYLCFAYATGLLSLSSLLFGWPQVHIPGLVALVGVLHLAEGALVYLDGAEGATPVLARNGRGQVVGAYLLQRFWPVPAAILVLLALPGAVEQGGIEMPGWWPLIAPAHPERLLQPEWVAVMLPLVAGLGYTDVALTAWPSERARRMAGWLLAYSLTLIGLAWGAQREPALLWVAALATPLLHEAMVLLGLHRERWGTPVFAAPPDGLRVLAVLPRSPAGRMGLEPGDRIVTANGRPVRRPEDLREAAEPFGLALRLEVERRGRWVQLEGRYGDPDQPLGVVLVPGPDQPVTPQVDLGQVNQGPLAVLVRRVFRWLGRRAFGGLKSDR